MRDLPITGSPEINTTQPSPDFARFLRRIKNDICSSRRTRGVVAVRNASNRLSVSLVPISSQAGTLSVKRDGPKIAILEKPAGQPARIRRNDHRPGAASPWRRAARLP
jgi:hypothetical protein